MFCMRCGSNMPEDSNFCPNCGASIHNNSSATPVIVPAKPKEQRVSYKIPFFWTALVLVILFLGMFFFIGLSQ